MHTGLRFLALSRKSVWSPQAPGHVEKDKMIGTDAGQARR
eukprot:COSAG03_NODE_22026_length_296_cov_0.786802_1_plen_39_part_01